MDKKKYSVLSPGIDEKTITKAVKSVRDNLDVFGNVLFTQAEFSTLSSALSKVKTWQDFHSQILFKYFVPSVIKNSVMNFEVSGLENLDRSSKYLFVSNHRDIVMDSIFIGYALLRDGYTLIQPVLGSNLFVSPLFESCFTLCGGIIIDRNLNPRELFDQSMLLSSYIYDSITSSYSSVWIAGGAGRSKDGTDPVKSSVLKMIFLSHRKEMSVREQLEKLKIVPVTLSYEFDPNAVMKSYAFTNERGDYAKTKFEDMISILRGIKCPKGCISVKFGSPVPPFSDSPEEIASYIENRIYSNYSLYPINYFAFDKLRNTDIYSNRYGKNSNYFSSNRHLSPLLQQNIIKFYAACVSAKEGVLK